MYDPPKIVIAGRIVGSGYPTYVIAEGCDNHMGDIDVAMEMARQAKLAGADAIKFQHHLPDEEMLADTPMSANFDEPLYEFLQKNALTLQHHQSLKEYCETVGIQYLCTPFSLKAAEEISQLNVPAYKIGSGEMTDIPTLKRIAEFQKPLIISTGMCTLDEIGRTYNALQMTDAPMALMNCTSEYPPVYEDINLGVIKIMEERFPNAVIGHSDHTPDLFTCFAAVALGACIIEKHVILDKRTPGPDQSVSIDFSELAVLVDGIKKVYAACGAEKKVHSREEEIREWAFRSIVSVCDIAEGETITEDMIWSKRPGTGIPSHEMDSVIGRTTKTSIPTNTLLKWEDLV